MKNKSNSKWLRVLLFALPAIVLAGCGGGGGGGDGDSPTPPPPGNTDTTPPVVTLVGESAVTLPFEGIYREDGATAQDNVDGNVGVTITGEVDTSVAGVYSLTYRAEDSAGNEGSVQRTVEVHQQQDQL